MSRDTAAVDQNEILLKTILWSSDLRALFGICQRTLERWVESGKLPKPMRPSRRRLLWTRESILAAIEKMQAEAQAS